MPKHRNLNRLLLCATGSLLPVLPTLAQPTQPTTQTRPADAQSIQGTITGVEGMVSVRLSEDAPWQRATPGLVVTEGAEFRTGPRSAVRIAMPPDQTLTLDRLGTVKLLDLFQSSERIKTDVGMKYGRVRFDIEAAGVKHDAVIHSPGSTLAVRGTKVSVFNQGFYPVQVVSLTGRAQFRQTNGQLTTFGSASGQTAVVEDGTGGAAQTAINFTYADPVNPNARGTPGEREAIVNTPVVTGFAFGPGTGSFRGEDTNLPPDFIPPEPPPPPPNKNNLPGTLFFELDWVASSGKEITPDLDLIVTTPLKETLSPKGKVRTTPSGGRAPRDDRGGSVERPGRELATFPNSFPKGLYTFDVDHVFGGSAEFALLVFRDGQLAAEPIVGSINPKDKNPSFSINLTETFKPFDPGGKTPTKPKTPLATKKRPVKRK